MCTLHLQKKFPFSIRDISDCNSIILSGRKYFDGLYLLKETQFQLPHDIKWG